MLLGGSEIKIRGPRPEDTKEVEEMLRGSRVFREKEIQVGLEVFEGSLKEPGPENYLSLVAECRGEAVGWISFGEIPCTFGSWDIYWVVVSREFYGKGIGNLLMRSAEVIMRGWNCRMILIETSSSPEYEPARFLYRKNGYVEAVRIPDCYAPREDKVVFMKRFDEMGSVSSQSPFF